MTSKPNDVRVSRELLPCPFCEGAARYVAADYVDNDGQPWPFAECDACSTGAPVEFWNKRAQPADQQGEPVRLTAVAVLRDDGDGGLQPDWLLEGGTAELWNGAVLIVADEHPEPCEEDGSAELYRHAQPATAKVDERLTDATAFVQKLCDAASSQPSVATGYLSDILDVLQGRSKLNAPQ